MRALRRNRCPADLPDENQARSHTHGALPLVQQQDPRISAQEREGERARGVRHGGFIYHRDASAAGLLSRRPGENQPTVGVSFTWN